jgi:hypothetical protein
MLFLERSTSLMHGLKRYVDEAWIAGISIGAINGAIIARQSSSFASRSAARILDAGDFERTWGLVKQPVCGFGAKRPSTQSGSALPLFPTARKPAIFPPIVRLKFRKSCHDEFDLPPVADRGRLSWN